MDDLVKQTAYKSSWNMASFATIALDKYPEIKRIVLVDRPVRVDKMSKICKMSNDYLKEIVGKINNKK